MTLFSKSGGFTPLSFSFRVDLASDSDGSSPIIVSGGIISLHHADLGNEKKKERKEEAEDREAPDDPQLARSPVIGTVSDAIGNSKRDISDTLLREAVESSSCQRSSVPSRFFPSFMLDRTLYRRMRSIPETEKYTRSFSRKDSVDFGSLKTAPISGRAPYVPL